MQEEWPTPWINEAVAAARKIWTEKYKPLISLPAAPAPAGASGSAVDEYQELMAALRAPVETSVDPFEEFIIGGRTNDKPIEY